MSAQSRKHRKAVAQASARASVDAQFVESLRLEVENRRLRADLSEATATLERLRARYDVIVRVFASQAYERHD